LAFEQKIFEERENTEQTAITEQTENFIIFLFQLVPFIPFVQKKLCALCGSLRLCEKPSLLLDLTYERPSFSQRRKEPQSLL
jgi:hypothetical protein